MYSLTLWSIIFCNWLQLQFRIGYYIFPIVFVVVDVETVFSVSVSNEFQCSFHFCVYPNFLFSLCMAKINLGMFLVRFLNTCIIIIKKIKKEPLKQL